MALARQRMSQDRIAEISSHLYTMKTANSGQRRSMPFAFPSHPEDQNNRNNVEEPHVTAGESFVLMVMVAMEFVMWMTILPTFPPRPSLSGATPEAAKR